MHDLIIRKKLEKEREKLNNLTGSSKSLLDSEVIETSHKLDDLIIEFLEKCENI